MAHTTWSLRTLQDLNRALYGTADDRKYGLADIISYVHRHITQILKNVRKDSHQHTRYHLCSAFSWMMAYANRMHININEEMGHCFPGCCPYCAQKPCTCQQRGNMRSTLISGAWQVVTLTTDEWQKTIAEIYPANTLLSSAMHLAEEIGELHEASRNYRRACDEKRFRKVIEEVIDIFANLFAVSACMHIDLGETLTRYFTHGKCPKCKECPCACEYVEYDEPIEIQA